MHHIYISFAYQHGIVIVFWRFARENMKQFAVYVYRQSAHM